LEEKLKKISNYFTNTACLFEIKILKENFIFLFFILLNLVNDKL